MLPELAPHLQRMVLFGINSGARQEEICGLRWRREQRVPELDALDVRRTVFVLPGSVTKNGEPRVLVLNDVVQSLVEAVRTPARRAGDDYLPLSQIVSPEAEQTAAKGRCLDLQGERPHGSTYG